MNSDNVIGTNTETRKLPLLTKGREVEVSQTRSFQIERAAVNKETNSCELSFSSETPVERWYGNEILSHAIGACDLSRLNSGGPLLLNHDRDCQCGVVENARIEGGKGRAVVRFSKSEDGAEIMNDVADGIRRNVSVSYEVKEMVLQSEKDGVETYLITRWMPLEISLVSIPADTSVGVGRSLPINQPKEKPMDPVPNTPAAPTPGLEAGAERKSEQKRCAEIMALAKQHNRPIDEAEAFINDGKDAREFSDKILAEYRSKPQPKLTPDLGLSRKEVRSFSFLKAIRALADGNDQKARKEAAFEFEVSDAAQAQRGFTKGGLYVPPEILMARRQAQRDLTSTDADGGYLIATNNLGAEFIDILRNRMVVRKAGARVLSGLRGDITIPKRTVGAVSYWVTENNAPTEGSNTYDQVSMTPNTVGCWVDIGRRLAIQSDPSVEQLVREDIAMSLAVAIDVAALHGGGTTEPTGLAGTTGIGSVAIGDSGGYLTRNHIIDLETETAVDNADVANMCYITNAKVRGRLKKTQDGANTIGVYLWQDSQTTGEGMLNGYRALCSNQVSSALTKGGGTGLSAVFFGDFSQLIIGEWGGLDILVDPYTGSAAGTTRIRALQEVDVCVRLPQSFAACLDVQT